MGFNSSKNILVCIPEKYFDNSDRGYKMTALLNQLSSFADEEAKKIPHEVINLVITNSNWPNSAKSVQSVKVKLIFMCITNQIMKALL